MKSKNTDYDRFGQSSGPARRLLYEEELILEVTEALTAALDRADVSRSELARRLGKSRGFVSQVLAGGRNLTLRTVADVADAVGQCVRVTVCGRERWIEKNVDAIQPEARVRRGPRSGALRRPRTSARQRRRPR